MIQLSSGRLLLAGAMAFQLANSALALETVDFKLLNSSDEDLEASLVSASLSSGLLANDEKTPYDVVAAAQSDYSRLVEALYAQGYYSAVVRITLDGKEAAKVDPFNLPSQVNEIKISVDPGELFEFGTAQVGPLAPGTTKPEEFETGQSALATVVRGAARKAVNDWRSAGYAKAQVIDQSITAEHANSRLNVTIAIDPGPKLTFGDVTVTGESKTKPARVRQIAGIPRGEVYDPDAVKKGADRLRRTGTFKSVQVTEAETPDPDGSLDLGIAVIDRKPRRIGGGAELSTDEGVTLTGYWLHRNLFGGAERFSIDGKVTQLGTEKQNMDYSLIFRFEKPAVYGADTLFFSQLSFELEDEPDYIDHMVELTFGASREFSPYLTGELGVGVSYHEITDIYDGTRETRELFLYSLPAKLIYDRRDNTLDTQNGFFISAELTPFYEQYKSQTGGLFEMDARAFSSFGAEDSTVLAGRLQLGSLVGPDAVDAPPGYLFYSGGGGTVRGQPYESLGANQDGRSLGGKALAVLSGEVRYSITDTIGVVGFADAGFVGADSFDEGEWHAGAGLGMRYKTPIGPIRVDAAFPVSGETSKKMQLYIGIGQAF